MQKRMAFSTKQKKTLITKRILLPLFLEGLNFNYFGELGVFADGEPIESFGCPEEFELGKSW
jgi:hypothetical protein